MHPDDIWSEQLVTSADVAPDGTTGWVVRRPTQARNSYDYELWCKRPGQAPHQSLVLPHTIGPLRLNHSGQCGFLISTEGAARDVLRVDLGSSDCAVVAHTEGARQIEPNPVDDRIAVLCEPTGPTSLDLVADESYCSAVVRGPSSFTAGHRECEQTGPPVLTVIDGNLARAVQLPAGMHIGAFGWASDGNTLWITISRGRQHGPTELWMAEVDDLRARLNLRAPGVICDVAWNSEHGIAVVAHGKNAWADQPELYLASTDHSRLQRINDDQYIGQATLSDILSVPGSECDTVAWRSDGSLLFITTQEGLPRLLSWRDGTVIPIQPSVLHVATVRSSGSQVVAVARAADRAADVWHGTGARLDRISDHGGWLPVRCWPRAQLLTPSQNSTPGPLGSWIFHDRHLGTAKPLLVHLHGGPYNAHGPLPWLEICLAVCAGFDVLCPNPPGSASFGNAYSRALLGRWGSSDVHYVNRSIDLALDLGFGALGWLGVMGMSYGGYLAAQLLAKTSRFDAGIIENAPMNLVSLVGTSDLAGAPAAELVGTGSYDQLWAMSPLAVAAQIGAPVMLITSEEDVRVPHTELRQLQTALELNGSYVRSIRYPAEGHMMYVDGRPDRRIHRLTSITQWLQAHAALAPGPATDRAGTPVRTTSAQRSEC